MPPVKAPPHRLSADDAPGLAARKARPRATEASRAALRAMFDAAVGVINQKVDAVCADGTVTKEEAKEVHDLVHRIAQHHKQGKQGKKLLDLTGARRGRGRSRSMRTRADTRRGSGRGCPSVKNCCEAPGVSKFLA